MLVATIQIKMDENRINSYVLVQDDNEIVNAKNPKFTTPGTENDFKTFLKRLEESAGAREVLQEF